MRRKKDEIFISKIHTACIFMNQFAADSQSVIYSNNKIRALFSSDSIIIRQRGKSYRKLPLWIQITILHLSNTALRLLRWFFHKVSLISYYALQRKTLTLSYFFRWIRRSPRHKFFLVKFGEWDRLLINSTSGTFGFINEWRDILWICRW